jgi:hypothetical protein
MLTTKAVANDMGRIKQQKEEAKFRPLSDAAADSTKALQQLQAMTPRASRPT